MGTSTNSPPTGKEQGLGAALSSSAAASSTSPNKDDHEQVPPTTESKEGGRVVAKPAGKNKKMPSMVNKAATTPGAYPVDVALASSATAAAGGVGTPPPAEFAGPFGTMVDVDLEDGARNPVLHLVEANLVKDEPSEKILVAATPVVSDGTEKPGAVAAAKSANRRLRITIVVLVIVCAAAIGVGLYWGLKPKNTEGTRDRSETDYSDASSNYDASYSSSSPATRSRSMQLLARSRAPLVMAPPKGDNPLLAASASRPPQPKPTPAPTIAPTPAHRDDDSLPTPAPTRSYTPYLYVFRRPTYPPAISGAFVPTPTQAPTTRPTVSPTEYVILVDDPG